VPLETDAVSLLQWRGQMTDEEWVDLHASDDETYCRRLERDSVRVNRPKSVKNRTTSASREDATVLRGLSSLRIPFSPKETI
jgi:hypothetical protein